MACVLHVPLLSSIITTAGCVFFCAHLATAFARWWQCSSYSPKLTITPTQRLVVVTGCDSGIGLQTARRFDYAGFHVLACCLNVRSSGARDLQQFTSKRLRVLELDVTNEAHADRLVEMIEYLTNQRSPLARLRPDLAQATPNPLEPAFPKPLFGSQDGDLKLWALVNVAGVFHPGPAEMMPYHDQHWHTINVNVMSTVRLTQCLLPFLRRSKGRLVNIGSVASMSGFSPPYSDNFLIWQTLFSWQGRIAVPNATAYCVSKAAMRALTMGWRNELQPLGVKCCLIEPFACATNLMQTVSQDLDQLFDQTPNEIRNAYGGETAKKLMNQRFSQVCKKARISIETVSFVKSKYNLFENKI